MVPVVLPENTAPEVKALSKMRPCANTAHCTGMIETGAGNSRRKFCDAKCRNQARRYVRVNPAVDPDEVEFLDEHIKRQLLSLSRYAYTLRKSETPTTAQVLYLRDRADALLTDAVTRDRANGLSWRMISEVLNVPLKRLWAQYRGLSTKRNRMETWPNEAAYAPLRMWAEREFGHGAEVVEVDMEYSPGDLSVTITCVVGSDTRFKSYSGQASVDVIASLFKHTLERALP